MIVVIVVEIDLEAGDDVEVIDGPLEGTVGKVKSVNTENSIASIELEMFGRTTTVDLEFSQVRKITL